jgi:hypothetical protein
VRQSGLIQLQLVRRKEIPAAVSKEIALRQLGPAANVRVLSNALVTVLSINVFVISSLATFVLLFFYQP